jgi:organic radical activating enzyme
MTSIRESVRRMFTPVKLLPAGIYHYQAPPEDPRNYRLHLRLEPDGKGVLIINAATVLHLNPTAAEYAYHLVHTHPEDQAVAEVASRYRIGRAQIQQDYRQFVDQIDTLINIPDVDPTTFLDFDRSAPYSGDITAPYRLDIAITYRLPTSSNPQAAPTDRVTRELTTSEWGQVIDNAWQVGIPHIILTGGEPTLREDLPDLINRAERNGQVTGLLTNGFSLADMDYLNELLQTGLDHIMFILYPEEQKSWQALTNASTEDIFVGVHLTLTPKNHDEVTGLLERLSEYKINGISLSTSLPTLNNELQAAREQAAKLNLALIWDLPVPYSDQNPVALEIEERDLPEGAGRAWLYIEPDGDVLPTQGVEQVLGNILKDPWEKIWKS